MDVRLPAYVRLRDEFASLIASGVWRLDAAIPSEAQLARERGVSIGTVRKAVDQLVHEGLIERRQGSGTYIRRPAFNGSLFRFFQLRGQSQEPATIPESRLLARTPVEAPGFIRDVLGCEKAIRIERVRSLRGQPILLEEIYVDQERFHGFEDIPEAEIGPLLYPVYLERYGIFISGATDEISFCAAGLHPSRVLGIAEGDPVAVVERTALDMDRRPTEWRRAQGSAWSFRYRMTVS
jgi:GntR family transcriptional regulator